MSRYNRNEPRKPAEDTIARAKELAAYRLGRSECSASEMNRYLKRKGISEENAAQVIAQFIEFGYLSDERYAKMVARSQISRGKGPGLVRQKLAQKGVKLSTLETKTLVNEAVEGFDELARALEVLQARYPDAVTDKKASQRAYAGLIRRGFSFDVTRQALERLKKGEIIE